MLSVSRFNKNSVQSCYNNNNNRKLWKISSSTNTCACCILYPSSNNDVNSFMNLMKLVILIDENFNESKS